jgi:hypothetical protein
MFIRDDASDRISALDKEAARLKKEKDLNAAIACLQEAKALRGCTYISFSIAT